MKKVEMRALKAAEIYSLIVQSVPLSASPDTPFI